MHKKKILYFTYSLNTGGLETLVLELSKRINRDRFVPSICAFESQGTLKSEFVAQGMTVYPLFKKEGIDVAVPFKLAGLLKSERIDILHTHDASPWLYGGLARLLCPGLRLIHTEHSHIASSKNLLLHAENLLSKVSAAVVADSAYVAEFMRNKAKIKQLKIIYNGIDTEKFNSHQRFVIGNESSSNTVVIGTVARLVPVKDHRTLLQAFKLLASEYQNIELLIIGEGELRGELEEFSKRLGIQERVKFIGERHDISSLLEKLDIFVMSSLSEGLSIAILEAMASGLPVVATNVGGNSEIIIDGITGFLVPKKEPEKLAGSISILIKDKKMVYQMGQNGKKRVRANFSIDKMVDEYETLYEEV